MRCRNCGCSILPPIDDNGWWADNVRGNGYRCTDFDDHHEPINLQDYLDEAIAFCDTKSEEPLSGRNQ